MITIFMIKCILQVCGLSIINWSIKLLSTLKMESFKSIPVLDCLIPSSPIAEIIIVKYGDRFSLKKLNYFNEETMRRLKTINSQLTFPLMSRIAYSLHTQFNFLTINIWVRIPSQIGYSPSTLFLYMCVNFIKCVTVAV